jgi:hypothetical protein
MTTAIFAIVLMALIALRGVQAAGVGWCHYAVQQFINGQTLTMHLYTNNYTPLPNSTSGSFTELGAGGYSAQNLTGGGWTLTDDGTGTNGDYPNVTFTFTPSSPTMIYGYYVLDGSSNFVGGESFSTGPISFPASPSSLVITPGVRAQGN